MLGLEVAITDTLPVLMKRVVGEVVAERIAAMHAEARLCDSRPAGPENYSLHRLVHAEQTPSERKSQKGACDDSPDSDLKRRACCRQDAGLPALPGV
jgi:hypothetical protein